MKNRSLTLGAVIVIAAQAAAGSAGGRLEGSAGGNERGVTIFRPGQGQVGFYFTGPSGTYHFENLSPGPCMVLINGHVAPFVEIRDGRTTRLDWAKQPHYDPPCETWSPARVVLGQTFRATGTWMGRATFWIPGKPVRLAATIHEDGPGGRRIGSEVLSDGKVSWVTELHWGRGNAPLVEGRRYYLRIACPDGDRWNVGTPGLGDVDPDGMAHYDDVAQPDSDLSIEIKCLNDSLITQASGGKCLGYIAEGPGSGQCRAAGQTFVATTDNVLRAAVRAGWGGKPTRETDFLYAFFRDGPDGEQVGPAVKVSMVSDWGADALWRPGEVPLVPGKRYFFKAWRADGQPFYAYLTRGVYSSGTAWRDGRPVEGFDLDGSVVGEAAAGSVTYPYNVEAQTSGPGTVLVTWETGTPADSRVHYGPTARCELASASDTALTKRHRVVLHGLDSGRDYFYRTVSCTRKNHAVPWYSKVYTIRSPGASPAGVQTTGAESPGAEPLPGTPVSLVNPGFEQGLTGWRQLGSRGQVERPESASDTAGAHSGRAMFGWSARGKDRPGWHEPVRIDTHDLIHQTVVVERGRTYDFSAWLYTADRGSGWERDSRIQLMVDPTGRGDFGEFGALKDQCASQAYATHGRWRRCRYRFTAGGDRVSLGLHFWQWWVLEECRLYADDVRLARIEK